jgi:hypothetical protein
MTIIESSNDAIKAILQAGGKTGRGKTCVCQNRIGKKVDEKNHRQKSCEAENGQTSLQETVGKGPRQRFETQGHHRRHAM